MDLWLPVSQPCLTGEFQDNEGPSLKSQDGRVIPEVFLWPLHICVQVQRETQTEGRGEEKGENRQANTHVKIQTMDLLSGDCVVAALSPLHALSHF